MSMRISVKTYDLVSHGPLSVEFYGEDSIDGHSIPFAAASDCPVKGDFCGDTVEFDYRVRTKDGTHPLTDWLIQHKIPFRIV